MSSSIAAIPMSSRPILLSLLTVILWITGLFRSAPTSAAPDCWPGDHVRVWTAPRHPRPGEPLEVLAVATDGALERLLITDPAGRQATLRSVQNGGPPWSLRGTLFRPGAGIYRADAIRAGQVVACAEIDVGGMADERSGGAWDLATEALYSTWIEQLFDAPPEQSLSFDSLGPLLRDPERNFLFNFLGAGEDDHLSAEPDCADLPYFLRGYFAWKLGLPVAYRACSRGSRNRPPRCETPVIEDRFTHVPAPVATFRETSRRIIDTVHSGSARTGLDDDATDFYPVPLDRATLWPGTLYADPYGHVMILVKWVPPRTGQSGLLLAVDAQPDNSVTRKRFWEGTFLFARTPSSGPGFKAFRPLARASSGGLRALPNQALDGASGPPYSSEQSDLAPEDFYARMEQLINPDGLAPDLAYEATLEALMEQLETRLTSVDNGETYMRAHPGALVAMPSGPAIFETIGPWEDYATPSRDMRLLIAMNVLDGLSERIRRYPRLYRLLGESPESAAARIEQLHAQRLDERFITVTRSDGSPWRLSLRDLYARRAGLEVGYNPNDCVERRWGAAPNTPDAATCRRQAPRDQQARMEDYRPWFRDTVRPPR
jgi:hypothetical protein